MSVKRSATIQRILDKVFSSFGITDHTIFILTYKNQILEKNTKIGKHIKEQKAILKVIPICYPPVGCKYMKNPAILAVMYNHSLRKVCNGNLTPSYEYTVKLMAIALYERHMEDIDKYRNRRTLGLPMPSWATTKYKIKEDKWKNDLIVELNKLSFSDRFQAMEEYLKVAQNADIYGHEMFYMDDKHSSFLDIDSHGIKICGIFDKDNYFQWQQVKFIRGEKNNVFLRLNAPNNTSLLTLKIPFKDSEDANAFISYCLTVLCLRCAESTFNNFMIKEKTEKKYRALIDEYLTTIYLPDCSLTAETTQCTDNLPMDEEHSADNNDEYESEYTSGSYIIEDENQHEYQVQEDGEEEEKDDDDDDEESNEEDDGFEEDKDDYIEYEKHNEYREYDNKSEILLGEEEEAGTKEKCKKQYVENNSKPREAISDLKYESTMNDQVETLYQEKLMVPFDNELSQGALQNLIIKCINEDELIKSIKHKLKFVETNLDDKYDLDVKIEITATLMSEELYKTAQDKNYAKENKDNNSEEKETAI
ncbi:hypothetical protein T4E_6512 [Trichinella pseudospiralis]|uniref:FERM domain-containing protein n=1 Tax=Trichinella pseudospiralis TaxID=6337 RepID=A0A0V0XZX8_TRIPS|nr:hypothetical protein T4E_6512 [Trichinella pseudospiralis]